MKITIPTPCSENWDKMKTGINTRHCDSYSKQVYDFTKLSKEQTITALNKLPSGETCGRFKSSQVVIPAQIFFTPHYPRIERPAYNSLLSFLSLSLLLALTSNCNGQSTANSNVRKIAYK